MTMIVEDILNDEFYRATNNRPHQGVRMGSTPRQPGFVHDTRDAQNVAEDPLSLCDRAAGVLEELPAMSFCKMLI